MPLSGVYLVFLLASLETTELGVVSAVSVAGVFSRRDDNAVPPHSTRQVPESKLSSSPSRAVAETREYRRALRRSLVQIFGMTTPPRRRRRKATSGGVRHVPAYMR